MTTDIHWRTSALCAQTDPEVFFPEPGGSPELAKRICAACPVQAACHEDALAWGDVMGVWGGHTEADRRRIKRARGPICRSCGGSFTRSGNNAVYCSDICRQAGHRQTKAAYDARRGGRAA